MSKKQNRQVRNTNRKTALKEYGNSVVSTLGNVAGAATDILTGNVKNLGKRVETEVHNVHSQLKNAAKMVTGNHPQWYSNYPLDGLVALNFSAKRGTQYNLGGSDYPNTNDETLWLQLVSAAGYDVALVQPLTNQEWEQGIAYLYRLLRAANSGRVNYLPAHLEAYILTVRNIWALYSSMKRAYALTTKVSAYDTLTPEIYFNAAGLDYSSFISNTAELRMRAINISNILSTACPLKLDLIERTRWMFETVFLDGDDAKSVPIILRLSQFWTASTIGDTSIDYSMIGMRTGEGTGIFTTYDELISILENEVQTLNSSILSTIAGDILKTFGTNALYPAEIWDTQLQVSTAYDKDVLFQIKNARLLPITGYSPEDGLTKMSWANTYPVAEQTLQGFFTAGFVSENQGTLDLVNNNIGVNGIVDTYDNNVNAAQVLSLTRFRSCAQLIKDENSAYTGYFVINACGTEVLTRGHFFGYSQVGTIFDLPFESFVRISNKAARIDPQFLTLWTQVDWSPMVTPVISDGTDATKDYVYDPMIDLSNFAFIQGESRVMRNYHGIATLSLLKPTISVEAQSRVTLDTNVRTKKYTHTR